MNHAITLGDVLAISLIFLGIMGIGGLLMFLVWLFNPWRSGH